MQARAGRSVNEVESPALRKQLTGASQENQEFIDLSFERKISDIKKVEEKLMDNSGFDKYLTDINLEDISNKDKSGDINVSLKINELTPKKENNKSDKNETERLLGSDYVKKPFPELHEKEVHADALTKSTSSYNRDRQSSFPNDDQPRRRFLKPKRRATNTSLHSDYEIFGAFCSTSLPNKYSKKFLLCWR